MPIIKTPEEWLRTKPNQPLSGDLALSYMAEYADYVVAFRTGGLIEAMQEVRDFCIRPGYLKGDRLASIKSVATEVLENFNKS